jgi:hypothetical protein
VVQFGLVDNEYLFGREHREVGGVVEGDVALGGETGLARGAFGYPPHDVD